VAVAATAGYLLAGRNSQPSTTSQPSATSTTTASTTTTPTTAPPVAEAALQGLLLSPDQINTAMGATGMTVDQNNTNAMAVESAYVADKACLPLTTSAESAVYAGSGWSALRGQALQGPGNDTTYYVQQAVVLFPSAHDAGAFFAASTQSWSACANRQFTVNDAGQQVWTVGPVSNTNGTLSATKTPQGGNGRACQRALTVANNVAIDIVACSNTPPGVGVNIANQIAAKVPTM
jgi:serine/threonine kinase PknH